MHLCSKHESGIWFYSWYYQCLSRICTGCGVLERLEEGSESRKEVKRGQKVQRGWSEIFESWENP